MATALYANTHTRLCLIAHIVFSLMAMTSTTFSGDKPGFCYAAIQPTDYFTYIAFLSSDFQLLNAVKIPCRPLVSLGSDEMPHFAHVRYLHVGILAHDRIE